MAPARLAKAIVILAYSGSIPSFHREAAEILRRPIEEIRAVPEAGAFAAGEPFAGISIIGSRFNCRIEHTPTRGGRPTVIPSIAGRGRITETKLLMPDPADPWPEGYRVGYTWPGL